MSGEQANPFAEIGEQLGLGSRWQPAVLAWGFAKLPQPGGEALHVIVFETAVGRVGVALPAASMREFARQSTEQVTGLVLPAAPVAPQ